LFAVTSCGLRVARRFPAAMPRRLSFAGESTKGYLARSLWVAVSQTAQVLLNGTDVLIIGAVLGPAAVVPYACTGKLIAVLANQPQAILQSAAPALSELRPLGDRARIVQVTSALSQATLAVSGLVACVVLAVNQAFISWWVGSDQFAGIGLTLLMLSGMLVRHFNTTNVYALFCFGYERRLALTTLADGLVTIVAGTAFIGWFGISGGPLAALVGVLAVSVPFNLRGLSAETGITRATLIATLGPWAIRFALVAIAAGVVGVVQRTGTFPALALTAGSAAALYVLAVGGPILRSPAGIYVQPILASLSRRFTPAWLKPRWLS
jgi:O-antigen/teichoic acid export membrane protein